MELPIAAKGMYLAVAPGRVHMSNEDLLKMIGSASYVQNPEKLWTQVQGILVPGIDGRGCETQEETFTQNPSRKWLFPPPEKIIFLGDDGRRLNEVLMEYGGTSFAREGPKWAELNMDILQIVLKNAGIETLLSSVPYVCKAWNEASCSLKCWENLDFPVVFKLTMDAPDGIPSNACIKSIVDRSCRRATSLTLPSYFTPEALEYVGNE